jgi:hypothetical protein
MAQLYPRALGYCNISLKSFYIVALRGYRLDRVKNTGAFLAHDSGRTLVRAECGYQKESPDTNS